MFYLLAETDPDEALKKFYLLIFYIALAGLIGVTVLVGLLILRRSTRRSLNRIEQDKADRRTARATTERVDAWQAGSERYVDHDKLPETDADENASSSWPNDQPEDEVEDEAFPPGTDADDPPPGWDEPDEEPDPYGLFYDKPYRDPDEDEDEEDENDNDDDSWDADEDRPR